ncbi:hypothetical protein J2Z40_002876 [Cytobacillus eiseniae]|uniref:Uncharacterized protein n=1 Tax=Cytobacillus eiseniae TaxID=762947 RepID=A0ABS4RHD4_9BACI|nr:hypothetical protein [Cytobacillus eiseniae]MBP2242302.1 hypothetical protein [Cytobacillus eiseniae]
MRTNYLLSLSLIFVLLSTLFIPSKSLATSWAYQFVVWDGYIYVLSDEYVNEIDKKIGRVTRYSDMESYSGNFSNTFKKGTKYYSIQGIHPEQAIAIEESEGRYIKAFREGKYEFTSSFGGQQGIFKIFIFSIVGIFALSFFYRSVRNNRVKR